jgi:hypothetical protein
MSAAAKQHAAGMLTRVVHERRIEARNDELMRAYQLTFNTPAGQRVLLDLMAFGKFRRRSRIRGRRQATGRPAHHEFHEPAHHGAAPGCTRRSNFPQARTRSTRP